jgi:hypothetical protein
VIAAMTRPWRMPLVAALAAVAVAGLGLMLHLRSGREASALRSRRRRCSPATAAGFAASTWPMADHHSRCGQPRGCPPERASGICRGHRSRTSRSGQ